MLVPRGCTVALVNECGSKKVSKSVTTTLNPLEDNDSIYKNPIVQELLTMLPKSEYNSTIEISFPITKKFIDKDKHIIAGYASVDVIDKQNELIPIPVIKDAWDHFKKNKDFYFGSLMHSNIPIIKILDEYKDKDGQVWKSRVDDNGLFIVAEVRQDIEKGVQTWELIEKGKLSGYSIGGEALASTKVCEGNKCFTRVDKMELHEIAVVDRPANAPSVFKIVKRDTDKNIIGKPFAGYKDFDACVRQNQDKNNPEAYCGAIKEQVEKMNKEYGVPKDTKERLISHFSLSEEEATKIVESLGEELSNKLLPKRGTGLDAKVNKKTTLVIKKETLSKFDKVLSLLN